MRASPWIAVVVSIAALGCVGRDSLGGGGDLAIGCRDDRDCGGPTPRCDVETGRCGVCAFDHHCPVGQVCRDGDCVRGCSPGRGCGDAGSCDVDAGVCRSCASDADCPRATPRCEVSRRRCLPCLPESDNCGPGLGCVATDDGYACEKGCKTDDECKADKREKPACCDHVCVDLASTNTSCGQCGASCAFPAACCAAQCNDFKQDAMNCGGCGKACALANATSACAAAKCVVASCAKGFGDCNGQPPDGCEVDLATDPRNCSGCGMGCMLANAIQGCAGGGCVVAGCKVGFADCDGQVANGCEVSTFSDAKNCGGCGVVCAVAHGTAGCGGGACTIASCNGAFADCDAKVASGCEVDTASDLANCGGCGMACPAVQNGAPGCAMGLCVVASCSGSFADCDQQIANGCEVDTATSNANCGGCKRGCAPANGSGQCVQGACTIASCTGPFADCDGVVANGCESNTATDPKSCGGCMKACPAGVNGATGCVNGACAVTMCDANFGDCNGLAQDGCEANLLADAKSCGGCGNACLASQRCVLGKCRFNDFGSGADGPLTVAAGQTVTIDTTRSAVLQGALGGVQLGVMSTAGFAPGATVMVHQTQGQAMGIVPGVWEMATVSQVGNGALTLAAPLQHAYSSANGNRAQVIVVPQYTDVTVQAGGQLTAPAWDGAIGGILVLQATGTAQLAGAVTMDQKGFRGSSHACFYRCMPGYSGESASGPSGPSVAANGAGGGGGGQGQDCGMGGGGGHGTSGMNGPNGSVGTCSANPHVGGAGGSPAGTADLTQLLLFGGAGGEGGGDEDGGNPGAGGNGGGIVWLAATTLGVTGTVSSSGGAGAGGNQGACGGAGCGMGGGGGGAGGAIRLVATTASLGNGGQVSASGAGGGACTCGGYVGGAAGTGRVAVKAQTIVGATSPPYFGG